MFHGSDSLMKEPVAILIMCIVSICYYIQRHCLLKYACFHHISKYSVSKQGLSGSELEHSDIEVCKTYHNIDSVFIYNFHASTLEILFLVSLWPKSDEYLAWPKTEPTDLFFLPFLQSINAPLLSGHQQITGLGLIYILKPVKCSQEANINRYLILALIWLLNW